MPNWTKEQELAIYEKGQNIIVSAGAGSGKTAVLSERVLQKIINGEDINHLLILTFTNLAASEMKTRIRKKLKNNPNLEKQLNKLDSSYITTFDSYSLSIVKKYHDLLGVSKNIKIIDHSMLNLITKKYLEDIFEDYYREQNPNFLKLIDDFCLKDDKSLKKEILKLNNKLDLLLDKKSYFDNYFHNFYNKDFIDDRIKEYANLIKLKIEDIFLLIKELSNYCDISYIDRLYELFNNYTKCTTYNEYLSILNINIPKLPNGSEDDAKLVKKEIMDTFDEIKNLLCYKDEQDIYQSIISTKTYLEVIFDIIEKLDEKLFNYKYQNDLYDFIDISKMAIKIIRENDNIRENIKNSFNEILVDEYQDTSDLQEEFLSLISNNNLYMVGDIKQSIYRFRNANPNIFKQKYDNYSLGLNGMKIDLLKNFRSRYEVLDNINLIFKYLIDDKIGGADYRKSHQMIFGNDTYIKEGLTKQNYNMEILNYEYLENQDFTKDEIEAFIMAKDILNKVNNHYQVFDKDEKKLRDIRFSDFSILLDRGASFDLYKKVFLYFQIPINILRDEYLNDTYDLMIIKNIFKILILVKNKDFTKEFIYCFLSIGRSFLFDYTDDELFDYIKNNNYQDSIILDKINLILQDIDSLTIENILYKIIEVFDYYNKIIKIGNIHESMMYLDYIKELSINLSNQGFDYNDFVEYLENLQDENQEIRFSINHLVSNSVNLMSIHKSKGLEYHICYFPRLYSKFNVRDLNDRFIYDNKLGIICPYYKEGIVPTIYKDIYKNHYFKDEISEKLRLLYVAFTRAKEKVILIMPHKESREEYQDDLVSYHVRMNYRSFSDMLSSIQSKLKPYMKDINIKKLGLTKDYKLLKNNDIINNINKKEIKIDFINYPSYSFNIKEETHFSKTNYNLISKEEKDNLDFGTKLHYILEIIDFKNNDWNNLELTNFEKEKVKLFLESPLLKNINKGTIYKEYEFIYSKDNELKHGIIDLMIEYDDYIDIIDYKLKNIVDNNYVKQLNGYKDYIMEKTNKKVNLYLYSLIDGVYEKI